MVFYIKKWECIVLHNLVIMDHSNLTCSHVINIYIFTFWGKKWGVTHNTYLLASIDTTYSTSMVDKSTTSCNLDLCLKSPPTRVKIYPIVQFHPSPSPPK